MDYSTKELVEVLKGIEKALLAIASSLERDQKARSDSALFVQKLSARLAGRTEEFMANQEKELKRELRNGRD